MTHINKVSIVSLRAKQAELENFTREWKSEMMRRAIAAYFKQGGVRFPNKYASHVASVKGIYYARVADENETLAVYRIRGENSFSRKARRWPKAIENIPVSRKAVLFYSSLRKTGIINYMANGC
jgi:hypothetical protein